MNFLVFQLYGAMASWGEAAVGGDRLTSLHPSRSAILGLLGAALGIRRDETSRLNALHQSVKIGIKQYEAGTLLRDFHTSQVPSEKKNVEHLTRREELQQDKLNTILSSRDYRSDGLWVIAIWLEDTSEFTLEHIQTALHKPKFVLSLGRKSCPLGLPLRAQIVTDIDLRTALDTSFMSSALEVSIKEAWRDPLYAIHQKYQARDVTYFWEGHINLFDASQQADQIQTYDKWDDPLNRTRWQFGHRLEHQLSVSSEESQ